MIFPLYKSYGKYLCELVNNMKSRHPEYSVMISSSKGERMFYGKVCGFNENYGIKIEANYDSAKVFAEKFLKSKLLPNEVKRVCPCGARNHVEHFQIRPFWYMSQFKSKLYLLFEGQKRDSTARLYKYEMLKNPEKRRIAQKDIRPRINLSGSYLLNLHLKPSETKAISKEYAFIVFSSYGYYLVKSLGDKFFEFD